MGCVSLQRGCDSSRGPTKKTLSAGYRQELYSFIGDILFLIYYIVNKNKNLYLF